MIFRRNKFNICVSTHPITYWIPQLGGLFSTIRWILMSSISLAVHSSAFTEINLRQSAISSDHTNATMFGRWHEHENKIQRQRRHGTKKHVFIFTHLLHIDWVCVRNAFHTFLMFTLLLKIHNSLVIFPVKLGHEETLKSNCTCVSKVLSSGTNKTDCFQVKLYCTCNYKSVTLT